ncbi:PREDICTED: 3 beta-hydroxysteroid dehydrogenase/Delta 5--_4-isomerase type 1 [Ceratosolen solmsi marchali]|uniref:3 beta-hydroxysteroid dehydrogenase/Delta 5-->4-isomerase type 1 n=1 Tax=Ceratosolen solmsi marchali TaxID=326594 RepID=A0AAJ6YSJ1_9HYME|nr:PREDICTED: 3 beta-hydroxysteroid dehydrogenase/Delta 5-->4-isomerase type 1 [Ceratosolen solmsi marchali]
MNPVAGEIVLLTGSSGFLGRHILKFLLEDDVVSEIRALDKVQACNNNNNDLSYNDTKGKLKLYECDLVNLESCREAFRNTHVVLHCAGFVSYDYPANVDELQKNNVQATENVTQLCIEENVGRLVHCSTTEVTLQSCFKAGIVAISIYKQESKIEIPENDKRLIFGEYAASKLKAEQIVIKSNGKLLKNGKGQLRTVALRPTLLYGEGDPHLLSIILHVAKNRGNCLPRLSGTGGKQQITYVGNAAWAFLRAKDTLQKTPEAIAGLPVTITDDTLVEDLTRFCERITRSAKNCIKVSTWPLPFLISYAGAWFLELLLNIGFFRKFQVSPRSLVAFLGSIILYNRARASIHMNYWPKYTHDQTFAIASKYYGELCSEK